jgi:DNA-binding CsgD family transcriptional regulator
MGPTYFSAIDPAAIRSVCEHHHRVNPWAPYQWYWPEGYFGHGYDIMGPSDVIHTEFYNDWMRPSGIGSTVSYGGFAYRRGGIDQVTIAILNDPKIQEYSLDREKLGRALMPCLRNCFLILERMGSPFVQSSEIGAPGAPTDKTAEGWSTAVLERIKYGAAVLDRNASVLCANGTAEEYFRGGVPLRKKGGRLEPASALQRERFFRLVSSSTTRVGGARGGAISFPSETAAPGTLVVILPFQEVGERYAWRSLALLIPMQAATRVPISILRQGWELTEKEAELCAALASARDVQVAAARIGISYEHSKTRLKTIRSKLQVQSNAEIVELMRALDLVRWS